MKYILSGLAFSYASIMLLAVYQLITFKEHPLVFILNLVGIGFTFLSLLDYRFLYLGMLLLLISAFFNGYCVLGQVTVKHLMGRFIFSSLIIFFNYWVNQ